MPGGRWLKRQDELKWKLRFLFFMYSLHYA
jgi:hypothetical protein